MRRGFFSLLIIAIIGGAGYWYLEAEAVCDVPIAYRIGSIDPRFGIDEDEVRMHVGNAESLWEDATGRNLFTYVPDGGIPIHFIYDERQAEMNAERNLRDELEKREWKSQEVRAQYERLLTEYERLKERYEALSEQYEEKLRNYNAEVALWNEKGGAPPDVYAELESEQDLLAQEQKTLNTIAHELNELIDEMNAIGSEGNSVINDYNEVVREYNERFTEEKEFTQGDYQGNAINIYQFGSGEELEIVLAHEFGHALSIEHVEGEASFMYHTMGAQDLEAGLTEEDLTAFFKTCGDGTRTIWSVL